MKSAGWSFDTVPKQVTSTNKLHCRSFCLSIFSLKAIEGVKISFISFKIAAMYTYAVRPVPEPYYAPSLFLCVREDFNIIKNL